jgi:hypothetical protein
MVESPPEEIKSSGLVSGINVRLTKLFVGKQEKKKSKLFEGKEGKKKKKKKTCLV